MRRVPTRARLTSILSRSAFGVCFPARPSQCPVKYASQLIGMRLRSWVVHPRIDLLDPLIEICTRHSPADRPNMADFHAELEDWLAPPELVPGAPGNLTRLRTQIEAATAAAARHHDEHMSQVRSMNDAVARLDKRTAVCREAAA